MIGYNEEESIFDVIPDEMVSAVSREAEEATDCEHLVCWTRSVIEAVAPRIAADESLLARIRAVSTNG